MNHHILKAAAYAAKAHAGQIRKFEANEPYVCHVLRVAATVAEYDVEDDVVIAALLHDVLEDCPGYTAEDIRREFGADVCRYVVELTDLPVSAGNRAFRKADAIKRLHAASPEAQSIKCADCLDNLPSIMANDKNFRNRFISEKLELMPGLVRAIPALYFRANNAVYQAAEELGIEIPQSWR